MSNIADKETILSWVGSDFNEISKAIKKLSYKILDNELSEYPILIASSSPIELGVNIPAISVLDINLNYKMSVLEELLEKKVLTSKKIEDFKKTFKDPYKEVCIFLAIPDIANFIFLAYP